MTVKYLAWAFETEFPLTATEKFILVAICDRCNADGVCWPSYDDLVARTGANRKTISKTIGKLEQMGILEKQRRFNGSNVYRVSTNNGMSQKRYYDSTNNGTSESTNIGTLTPKEPPRNPQESDLVWEQFWNEYPRKDGKKKAEASFKRLSGAKKEKAIADVKARKVRYESWVSAIKTGQKQYLPLPATYINGERWEDEWDIKDSNKTITAEDIKDFM